jgi:hypothetical protein
MESFIGKKVRGVDFTGVWRQGTVISENEKGVIINSRNNEDKRFSYFLSYPIKSIKKENK